MPIYIIDALGHLPGLSGLFVAGIFSASLSTISSALNSLSALTFEDYFKNIYLLTMKKPFVSSGNSSSFTSKIISTFYGAACIGVAFLAQNLGGVLQASLTIFGVIGGPLLGTFTLGMCTKVANQVGVVTGHLFGMGIAMWAQFGYPRPPPPLLGFSVEDCTRFGLNFTNLKNVHPDVYAVPIERSDEPATSYFYLYRLSYLYGVIIGFLVTLIIGYSVSYVAYFLRLQGRGRIYKKDSINEIRTELFWPPLARIMEKKTIAK